MDESLKFSNSYIALGEHFFQRVLPQKVPAANLLLWNNELANSLLIAPALQKDDALLSQYFSGNQLPEGVDVIALAYSGHQFGHFNPNLGDGRAHLLGELVEVVEGDLAVIGVLNEQAAGDACDHLAAGAEVGEAAGGEDADIGFGFEDVYGIGGDVGGDDDFAEFLEDGLCGVTCEGAVEGDDTAECAGGVAGEGAIVGV